MLKKLVIAAVAVIAGMVVLTKVTKVSPKVWFGDCCSSFKQMVPPETRLKQLKADIENIDRDVDKNLGTLAHMLSEVEEFGDNLACNRTRQARLFADIGDMRESLEKQTQKVVFHHGRKCDADDLTNRLSTAVTEYNCLKEKVDTQEKILKGKKRTLAAAKERIAAMKSEQTKLRDLAVRLEYELELVKMRQIQNQVTDFDDSALTRAQQNAKEVENSLRVIKHEIELKKEFGRTDTTVMETEKAKSREEVLRAAKAVQDEKTTEPVAENK